MIRIPSDAANERRRSRRANFRGILGALCLVACLGGRVRAACDDGDASAFTSIRITRASVDFKFEVALDTLTARWTFFDVTAGSTVPISAVHYSTASGPSGSSNGKIILENPMSPDHDYLLVASGLKVKGCDREQDPSSASLPSKRLRTQDVNPPHAMKPATSREDAVVYAAGLLDGAQGAKPAYTVDVKIQYPRPFPWWHPSKTEIMFVPAVDFKASTDPNADADSVLISGGLRFTFESPSLNHLRPFAGDVIESDKKFTVVNDVVRLASEFHFATLDSLLMLSPRPMVGFEAGSNIVSPRGGAYAGAIARPVVGLHLYADLFKTDRTKPCISIESSWTRRWPLDREPMSESTSGDNVKITSTGKNPRDYVATRLEWNFNDFFGVTLEHDYGELPPLFTLVRNKFSLGLVFKMGSGEKS